MATKKIVKRAPARANQASAKKPAKKAAKKATKKAAKKAPKKAAKKAAKKATKAAPAKASKASLTTKSATAKAADAAALGGGLVNHIAFVVDRSGSMSGIRKKVLEVFGAQLDAVKENAKSSQQASFVSYYTFSGKVDAPAFFAKPIAEVKKPKSLNCSGLTALYDATGTAITDLQGLKSAGADNVSFLVVVLTDGHENASRVYKKNIKTMLTSAQKTGRWTFAFMVPKAGVASLKKFGIPEGNIQVWNATAKGVDAVGKQMRRGLDTFYTARGQGQRAVKGVFTTSLQGVSAQVVSTTLTDSSKQFMQLKVTGDVDIASFVNAALKGKGKYVRGNGFYQLTKPETVQAQKDIAIVDKKGKVFVGPAARSLLGLPSGASCKVKPGDHGDFTIFVESTSMNRRLVAGTTLLYKK